TLTLLFFFQAEDGIRYRNVTGVQTCALPISRSKPPFSHRPHPPRAERREGFLFTPRGFCPHSHRRKKGRGDAPCRKKGCWWCSRSEERRVGKECRDGGAREQWIDGGWRRLVQ